MPVYHGHFREYAPAPGRRRSEPEEGLRPLHRRRVRSRARHGRSDHLAQRRSTSSTIANANAADVDTRVAAARRATEKTCRKLSGADQRQVPVPIARLVQELALVARGRRESRLKRQADQGEPEMSISRPRRGLGLLLRGLADKLDYGPRSAPLRRELGSRPRLSRGTFPRSAGREDARRRSRGQTQLSLKPDETNPLSTPCSPRSCSRPTCRRRSQHPKRPRATPVRPSAAPGCHTSSLHGVDRRRTGDRGSRLRHGQREHAALGGKAANNRVRRAPIRTGGEGIVNGIYSTRVTLLARVRDCWCR